MSQVAVLARIFGECREGRNTNAPRRIQLCCDASLMPRQLAAGYLTLVYLREQGIVSMEYVICGCAAAYVLVGLKLELYEIRKGFRLHCVVRKPV